MLRNYFGFPLIASLCLVGCSSDNGNPDLPGSGGSAATAGGNNAGLGGSNGSGGAKNTGGQVPGQGGGSVGQGGLGQGGALVGLGGAVTTLGGQTALGGNTTTGGKANAGGASGGNATGGKANGGATSGGVAAVGGSALGGKAAGGAVNVGGAAGKAAGGTVSVGGAATGGKAVGGAAAATGGTASGGANTGGANGGTTPIKVWIAGDSTVQNCSSACPCGWGSQFDPLFNSNVTVVNSAVGGRSIQTWLYEAAVSSTMGSNGECTLTSTAYNARWTAMTNASTGMKAGDYLLIDFGINDGDATCPRHVGTTLYQTYLGMMAKAAQAVGAHPVFLTPTNAITCSGSTVPANRGFITQTKAAGTTYGVPVIDLNQLTIALYTKLGFCPNNGDYGAGALGAFFCADHTHFEAAGAAQIAALVAQALKDQAIGLAAYLQ